MRRRRYFRSSDHATCHDCNFGRFYRYYYPGAWGQFRSNGHRFDDGQQPLRYIRQFLRDGQQHHRQINIGQFRHDNCDARPPSARSLGSGHG